MRRCRARECRLHGGGFALANRREEARLVPAPPPSISAAGLRELDDLQRLLRGHIDVVARDVLVISEEFDEWADSRRRIDFLGIDKDANLVVIELKRNEDGGHMELQALSYAAMISKMTAERAVEVFESYREKRGLTGSAEAELLGFLEVDGLDQIEEEGFGEDVRIVLVSADFSRELTTSVMWPNERNVDLRCVRIRLYEHAPARSAPSGDSGPKS